MPRGEENGKKKSKRFSARSGTHGNEQHKNVPSSVLELVNGATIDISGASDYFKKKAQIATLLKEYVVEQTNFRYALKKDFARYFFSCLSAFANNQWKSPADGLAEELFFGGQRWAKMMFGRLPPASIPTDRFLRDQWGEVASWDFFLQRDGCIGEAWWHNLGDDGNICTWKGEEASGDFELRIAFDGDDPKPPTMTLTVKGEPAAKLMKWWMNLTPNSPAQEILGVDEMRKQITDLLDSLLGALKINLKLIRPDSGRAQGRLRQESRLFLGS